MSIQFLVCLAFLFFSQCLLFLQFPDCGGELILFAFRFTLGKSSFLSFVNALVSALSLLFDIKQAIGYCAEERLHLRFRNRFFAVFVFGYTEKALIVVMDEIG